MFFARLMLIGRISIVIVSVSKLAFTELASYS